MEDGFANWWFFRLQIWTGIVEEFYKKTYQNLKEGNMKI
jgi:hypothetical protein